MDNQPRRVRLVTDSAADLDPRLAEELGITVVPLIVTFGENSYLDTPQFQDQFWRLVAQGLHPKTSQPAAGTFATVYQGLADDGYQVLCITVTGKHSGCYSTAWGAAQAFGDQVHVVDSASLSWGQGWQVAHAARMANEGASLDEILAAISSLRERTTIVIQFESVESLRRGGRAAKLMPALERLVRALDLRPLINVVDGELKLLGVARTKAKGLARMASEMVRNGRAQMVGIVHIGRPHVASELADLLAEKTGIDVRDIHIGTTGAVLATHAGDGVVAAIGLSVR